MKKFLSMFLVFAVALTVLTGCSEMSNESQGELSIPSIDPIERFDNESMFFPGESSVSEENSDAPSTEESGFLVKDKKYAYEGNEFVILEVENKTEVNYSITITGQYHDENGTVLKTETQTFDQFYAGYHNYFIFQPQIQFSKFTYSLNFKKYSGTLFAKAFGCRLIQIEERKLDNPTEVKKGNYTLYPGIVAAIQAKNDSDTLLQAYTYYILINENNEVVAMFPRMFVVSAHEKFNNDGANHVRLYQPIEPIEELEWPEKYKGEIKAIICVQKVTDQIQYG